MSAITFIYGQTTLPSLLNRNAEGATDWATAGNHTVSTSVTYAHGGTKSFKVVASAAGDATTNYANLPSGSNATLVVGQMYCVTLWMRSASSVGVNIKTGGVVSDTIVTPTADWGIKQFKFTCVTATTAAQIYAQGADTFYFDDLIITKYIDFSTPLSVRGFDEPDKVEFFPALQADDLGGGVTDKMVGFRRRIFVDLGVVPLSATRKELLHWMLDTSRQLNYLTEYQIPVALGNVEGFENEWKGSELGRAFAFDLRETSIRTTFPV